MLCENWGASVSLVFQDVERPVYIASGNLAIDVQETSRQTINGRERTVPCAPERRSILGDHGEQIGAVIYRDYSPRSASLLASRSLMKLRRAQSNSSGLKRSYDLMDVPKEKRFRIDPDAVLKKVTAQTGVEFEKSVTRVSILRLRDN